MTSWIFKYVSAVLYIMTLLLTLNAQAQNRRHLTTADGLSNMSILSLTQDRDGYIWVATCDGVNRIENSRILNFAAGNDARTEFSGNLIETIRQDSNGDFWVHTNYGFDRLDTESGNIEYHREFNGYYFDALAPDGDVILVANADSLHYYNKREKCFRNLGKLPISLREIKALHFDENHNIWIAHNNGLCSGRLNGNKMPEFREMFSQPIRSANISENRLFFITEDKKLMSYDFSKCAIDHICSLPENLYDRGDATVITDGEDYVMAFKSNGAVRLKRNFTGFEVMPYDIQSGVFSVLKDRNQDILWFGTDGEGIYYYAPGTYNFYSQTQAGKNHKFAKPVRAIFADNDGTVWAGTKGDGLFGFHNFKPGAANDDVIRFTTANSQLNSNEIYALAPSSRRLFWIGTQAQGLSYYSYVDRRIHHLDIPMMQRLQSVHDVHETAPDELWVATVGEGVFRLAIGGDNTPVVLSVEEVIYDAANTDANAFFSIEQQNDSILWFGNRGMGAYRYNRLNRSLNIVDFASKGKAVANDVFCIYTPEADRDTAYCATSAGLFKVFRTDNGIFEFSEVPVHDRHPVHSVHAVLDGGNSNMIASTNFGLTDYILPSLSSVVYSSGTDFSVRQFSDGAAYRDPQNGTLYFGASNGFVTLVPDNNNVAAYNPPVIFRLLLAENESEPISRNLDKQGRLVLPYDKNSFTISFNALDYCRGKQFVYRYRLNGASDQWIDNFSGQVSFTNMSPGRYDLEVCYNNGFDWSDPYLLEMQIKPPFYASTAAYIIYGLLLVALVIFLIFLTVRIQHRKQSAIVGALEQKRKEDVYEAKLKFFTNITHELFTPLTLINGSCEKMIADGGLQPESRKLTKTIHRNSNRLTELIQELLEFRRIDTEYRKPDVEALDVSAVTEEIIDNFSVLAEKKQVTINAEIAPEITWPTDRSGFVTIVTNLMSNAMKYTHDGGEIRISLRVESNRLQLKIANTGEGIPPENISQIFDRYKVLERFERLSAAGTIKRNGLGLAVCDGLVKLLSGSINVESRQGEWTTFNVELPEIPITRIEPSKDSIHYQKQVQIEETETEDDDIDTPAENSDKPLIFVIDDNADMLSFVAGALSGLYRVRRFTSGESARDALQKEWPALIVCDVVMDGMSGIEFAREIKSNKATLHIPFVQLSSLHSEEEKIKSLEAGADSYVTKPFKIDYLLAVIDRLLRRKQNLKEYFDSSISSYEKVDGQMLHSDDQDFLKRVLNTIEDNIANPELSTKLVAEMLGLSMRNLYRRLEGITEQTPTMIIKEMRLATAKNLLTHTTLSIDEVIYKSGFNNRGTFFKLFQQKFGCTPKQYRDSQVSSAKTDLGLS